MSQKIYGEKWQVIEPLNEGGQSWTYIVKNVTNSDDRRYVLKRLKNKKRLDRFETEIRAVQMLSHPNIVRIVDHDVSDSEPYFVMEHCSGGDLETSRPHGQSVERTLTIFQNICEAVGEAHDKKIIHRDIKPANILFREDGTPVVSDFGICFVTEEGIERVTQTAEQMGPRFFMSPELADGRADQVTPESDVYSLGKLLYWMLSGKVMARENFADRKWDLRDSSSSDHSVHQAYDLLEKSIAEKPHDRFVDGATFAFEVGKTLKTIEHKGHHLDRNLPQRCVFCGQGRYVVTDTPTTTGGDLNYSRAHYLGLTPQDMGRSTSSSGGYIQLRTLECEFCGNLQIFRMNEKFWKS